MPLTSAQLCQRHLIDVVLVFLWLKASFSKDEASKLIHEQINPVVQNLEYGAASSSVISHMKMKFIITELQLLMCLRGTSSKQMLKDIYALVLRHKVYN